MKINSKEYWEYRFRSGDWERKAGRLQTRMFARNNLKHINLPVNFSGSILDFGCGLGDSLPVYKAKFPNATFFGVDISTEAIKNAQVHYGDIASFSSGVHTNIPEVDVIIASNVLEHIVNDREIVKELLKKCKKLYISVPYREILLFEEHVNSYDNNYFKNFKVEYYKTFYKSYNLNNYELKIWFAIRFKNFFRRLLGKKLATEQEQVLFCLLGEKR